jgi:hypothetical protein
MKKLAFCGVLIALFSVTQLSAKTVQPNNIKSTPAFNDCPKVTETDPDLLRAATKASVPATVTVYGAGGYNPSSGAICPDSSSSICAYIITEFIDGSWGPDALVEDNAQRRYFGVIDSPIEDEDGNVINFKFSSLTPIE